MPTRDVPNFSDYAELLFGVLSQIRIDGLSGYQKEKDKKKKKNCKKHVKSEGKIIKHKRNPCEGTVLANMNATHCNAA